MRHLSEIPANRGEPSWFDRDCQLVNDSDKSFAKRLAQGPVPGKTAFCFFLSDEKLLGSFWVLIHIATTLRRLVATIS
jgi:hypothetical protein